ncbi:MAG: hypothetical protein Kow0059_05470 [Candidatus Sumerlaeia bacterium]
MSPSLIIAAFAVFVVGLLVVSILQSIRRRKELAAWAAANGLSFSAAHEYGVEGRHPGFRCLRRGSNRFAYNLLRGTWRSRPFEGFDYHYETYTTDSKGRRQTHHHHFSCVVLGSPVPLKPLFIRPEGFWDKLAEFVGADDIDFESAEFSRTFYVKSPDRRWAYDVIHPRAMEFLLAQPRFSIEFDAGAVIAWLDRRFSPGEFAAAADVIHGLLERLPGYLVRQQTGR